MPQKVLLEDARAKSVVRQSRVEITRLQSGNKAGGSHLLKHNLNAYGSKLTLKYQPDPFVSLISQQ
jgi:hypothetical protein